MTLKDVLYAAARAAHKVQRSGSHLNTSELGDGLILANQTVGSWAGRKVYAWSDSFTLYTLSANHQPHLLGPNLACPDFALPASAGVRPERIPLDGAALVLTSGVDIPLRVRDGDWWNDERVKSITSPVPTDLYYSPDWPNGSLWLWPVPAAAYGLRLRLPSILAQFATVNDNFTAPPRYLKAFTLTIAEEMCDWFGLPVPPLLPQRASHARAAILINNVSSPRIASADLGMRGRRGGAFNYYSGQ